MLDFENRLHYKLVGVNYPDRKGPWFVITWNCGNGILKSDLTNRRFDTQQIITPGGDKVKFDFIMEQQLTTNEKKEFLFSKFQSISKDIGEKDEFTGQNEVIYRIKDGINKFCYICYICYNQKFLLYLLYLL